MLNHLNDKEILPSRVVVLGRDGFVASHILQRCEAAGISVLGVSKKELDLEKEGAALLLADLLKPSDVLVIVAAKAPCKNNEMLMINLRMMQAICTGIEKFNLSQVIYISSDAVYADEAFLVNEATPPSPGSLHGLMHAARELMLKTSIQTKIPLVILRPSVLYGLADPHNGYGPNRFRRLIEEGKTISLFGEGEEKRDHIDIQDVADIVLLAILHRSKGLLNIATGESWSFREVAETLVSVSKQKVDIQGSPRQNPITHRHFDISNCYKAFPKFHYTTFKTGILKMLQQNKETAHV